MVPVDRNVFPCFLYVPVSLSLFTVGFPFPECRSICQHSFPGFLLWFYLQEPRAQPGSSVVSLAAAWCQPCPQSLCHWVSGTSISSPGTGARLRSFKMVLDELSLALCHVFFQAKLGKL